MAANLPIQPLQGQFKIADPETGLPTQEFLLYMKAMYDLLPSQEAALAAIEGAGLTPLSERILLGNNTRFGDEIEIDADTQAILNEISTTWGSILYRGENEWASLAPGTPGHVLHTAGVGADPAWAAAGGGGGGGAWSLVDSWDHGVTGDVANVDFTGLGGYDELLFFMRGVSASASGLRRLLLSTNGGSTFYTTSGDYERISNAGAATSENEISLHGTDSSAARSGGANILHNLDGVPKALHRMNRDSSLELMFFTASLDSVNAIRFDNNAGGNLTAGTAYLLGR